MSSISKIIPFDMSGAWYSPLLGYMYIWHSCLEITITNGQVMHHLVLDGKFFCDDYDYLGRSIQFTGKVEEPLSDETAKGAKQVLVFRYTNGNELARRFIDANGNLNLFRDGLGKQGYVYTKTDEHPCPDSYFTGYNPEQCLNITYPDLSSKWTAACCADDAIEPILRVPGPAYYGGSTNPKWSRCEDFRDPSSTAHFHCFPTNSVVMLLCTFVLFMM